MAALASGGGPQPPQSTVETVSVKTEETEPETTVMNPIRSDVEEEQNTIPDDKMCEDLDSDDEGALRIAESEPETNTTPSADDAKQENDEDDDDDDEQVGKRVPKTEIMSDDEKSMDESTSIENNESHFLNSETNSSNYIINTSKR